MKIMTRAVAILALLLVVAACGDDQDSQQLPPAGDDVTGASGTCLEGTPDCNDTPLFYGDEPQDGITPDDGSVDMSGMPAGDGLSVSEALATTADGPLMVRGFYFDDGSGPRLCEALAESFPPQCGMASIPLAGIEPIDPESIKTEQGTSWTDEAVFVLGDIVDGVLVPTETSI